MSVQQWNRHKRQIPNSSSAHSTRSHVGPPQRQQPGVQDNRIAGQAQRKDDAQQRRALGPVWT